MNRPRLFRGLRIAWTVGFGILCLLLIALWVRSYWFHDMATKGNWHFNSIMGASYMTVLNQPWTRRWELNHLSLSEMRKEGAVFVPSGRYGLDFEHTSQYTSIQVPFWLLTLSVLIPTFAPWVRFRFSLSTLFIVTTLIALGLGLIVWATR